MFDRQIIAKHPRRLLWSSTGLPNVNLCGLSLDVHKTLSVHFCQHLVDMRMDGVRLRTERRYVKVVGDSVVTVTNQA